MLGMLHRSITELLDLAYPGKCIVCHQSIDQPVRFCQSCNQTLTQMEDRSQCLRCGAPVAAEGSPCQRCNDRGYRVFDTVVRSAVFEGPLHDLVLRYKFYHSWTIGELLADRALRLERVRSLLDQTDLLVPIPLHPWRQVVRGFNQAEVFANRLGRKRGIQVQIPLIRTRLTSAQSLQTSRRARFENMRHAFALVNPAVIRGRKITLVDDVITTAATLRSAANVIKEASPASISVLTIAIADPKGRQFEMV